MTNTGLFKTLDTIMSGQNRIFISVTGTDTETDEMFLKLLKTYQSVIHSCIGPCGSSKLLCRNINPNSADLTSSSTNIASILYNTRNIKSSRHGFVIWKLDLINATIKSGHLDHFYDAGLFLFHLINDILIHAPSFNLTNFTDKNLLGSMLKSLHQHLSADSKNSLIVTKVNLTDAGFIRKFLYTILNSKCLIEQMDEAKKNSFVNLCLKGFIKSFKEVRGVNTDTYFSPILFLYNYDFSSDLCDSQLLDGVLFQTEQNYQWHISSELTNTSLRCVLFDSSFSGDFTDISQSNRNYQLEIKTQEISGIKSAFLVVEKMIKLCEYLIQEHDVKVILCQKVIHPSVKSFLKRKDIFFIDRLSGMLTKSVSELTGCRICSSVWNLGQFNRDSFGILTSLSFKKILDKSYIHLENNLSPQSQVQTMVVCMQNETMLNEIQVGLTFIFKQISSPIVSEIVNFSKNLVKVAQLAFQRAILSGRLLCGGACFYLYSMCYLWKFLYQEFKSAFNGAFRDRQIYINRSKVFQLMSIIQTIFINFAKNLLNSSLYDYKLDTSSGHLFQTGKKRCNCGFLGTKSDSLINIFEPVDFASISYEEMLCHEIKDGLDSQKNLTIIDCLESKLNSLMICREIVGSILQVGVFLHD